MSLLLELRSSVALGVIWNPSDANAGLTLTNGCLTITKTGGFGLAVGRCNTARTSGFLEFTIVANSGFNSPKIGFDDGTTSLSGNLGGTNSIGWNLSTGAVTGQGSALATWAALANGDVAGVSWDGTTFKGWKNGVLQGSVTPGGLSSLYPAVYLDETGASVRLNAGASTFTGSIPAGLASWDGSQTSGLVGSSSLAFSPSATLLGQGAVSASSTLTFAPSATLLGKGAVSGASTLAFAPSATLLGRGAVIGSSSLTFAPSATLLGLGAVSASASLTFSPSATLLGSGALAGSSAVAFAPSGSLLGQGAVTGAAALSFVPAATLQGVGSISGSSSLSLSSSATLTGIGALLGSTALSWAASATLTTAGANQIQGTSSLSFLTAATLLGAGQLQGAADLSFAGSATLLGRGQISGSTSFSLTIAGQLVFGFSGQVKVNILDEWQAKPVKVWDGSAWAVRPLKYWDGAEWRATAY